MTAEEPGPLPRGLLDRLASRPDAGGSHTDASPLAARSERGASHTDASLLAADLAVLRDSGYLKLALPARFGGAGLGLAIVKSITQAHDGTLTLIPRAAGGLCVTVQLPVVPPCSGR